MFSKSNQTKTEDWNRVKDWNWRTILRGGLKPMYKIFLHGRPSWVQFLRSQMTGSYHSSYRNWVHWFNSASRSYSQTKAPELYVLYLITVTLENFLSDKRTFLSYINSLSCDRMSMPNICRFPNLVCFVYPWKRKLSSISRRKWVQRRTWSTSCHPRQNGKSSL